MDMGCQLNVLCMKGVVKVTEIIFIFYPFSITEFVPASFNDCIFLRIKDLHFEQVIMTKCIEQDPMFIMRSVCKL